MCPKTTRILISCVIVTLIQQAASAGVIDTLPPHFWAGDPPPRCLGGTFRPTAPVLEEFTVSLQDGSGSQYFRLVVFSTDVSGYPDTLLWAGPETYKSSWVNEYDAFPALDVDPANRYFIGVDTGLFTSVKSHSGYIALGMRNDNPIPEGCVFVNKGGGWIQESGNDVSARITMAPIPEPTTLTLVAIGSAVLLIGGWRRRKK